MAPDPVSRVPLDQLPAPLPERLRLVARAAGDRAWLVGGAVRDLLLGRDPLDLDVVVEADAAGVARRLPGVEIVATSQFLTAVIRWPDGSEWDLVTARRETYPRPGALPTVKPAKLDDDLRRRDFTVNALAADLSPARWGELVDPTGGLADLRAGRLRVLHDRGFTDDPTRIVRLLRYQVRLGFEHEPHTHDLLALASIRGQLLTVGPDRLRPELVRSLSGPDARAHAEAVYPYATYKLGCRCRPQPPVAEATAALFERLAPADPPVGWRSTWLVWLLTLIAPPDWAGAAKALCAQLNLDAYDTKVVTAWAQLLAGRPSRSRRPSRRTARYADCPPEALVAYAARRPAIADDVVRYLSAWRHLKPTIGGGELAALGLPRGPIIGRVLAELKRARLDSEVLDDAQELALAHRLVAESDHGRS